MKEKLSYEKDVYHKVSPSYIKRKYDDGILIWVSGSGGPPARYRVVLEYRGKTRYLEQEVGSHTANQAMILGAVEAVRHIKRPDQIYLVCPAELGFLGGLKGKGPNVALIQELLEEIVERGCRLTEVYIKGGGDAIKEYVWSVNPDRGAEVVNRKVNYWRERNYDECLEKVVGILQECGVEAEIIEKVRAIRPEESEYGH